MHYDKAELAQVSQTGLGRYDMYRKIHKALRMALADALVRVGQLDTGDDTAVQSTGQRVAALVDLCEHHLEKENSHIHPALEARAPGASERTESEHGHHRSDFARLRQQVRELCDAPAQARGVMAHTLYHELALFMAHNLVHMYVEETVNNGALWKHYTDADIQNLERELVASIPPEDMQGVLKWMLPAINHEDRLAMFSGMKQGAPRQVLDANLRLAFEVLPLPEWRKLMAALNEPVDVWATMA